MSNDSKNIDYAHLYEDHVTFVCVYITTTTHFSVLNKNGF